MQMIVHRHPWPLRPGKALRWLLVLALALAHMAAAAAPASDALRIARELRQSAELMRDAVALDYALTEASRWFDDVLATGIDGGEAAMNARGVLARLRPEIDALEGRIARYAPLPTPVPPLHPLGPQFLSVLTDYPGYLRRLAEILEAQRAAGNTADRDLLRGLTESWNATSAGWFDRFSHAMVAERDALPPSNPEHFAMLIAVEEFDLSRVEQRVTSAQDLESARARLLDLGEAQERFSRRVAAATAAAEVLMPDHAAELSALLAPALGAAEAKARVAEAHAAFRGILSLYGETVTLSRTRFGLLLLWANDPSAPELLHRWSELFQQMRALNDRLAALQVAYYAALAPASEDPGR